MPTRMNPDGSIASDWDMNVTGRKVKVVSSNYDQVLNVPANGSITITIMPEVGELWGLKNLYINVPAPAGGTAGTHYVLLHGLGGSPTRSALLYALSNYGDAVQIRYNTIATATASNGKIPSTEQAQQANILSTVATNATPIKLYYFNGTTGGNQTGTISITVDREVEYIV